MRIGEKKQQILSTFKKGWVSIMDQGKLTRVLKSMEEHEIPQMIISDPVAIFYLTGKWIFPGERLLALYLNVNGNHKMMINKLFPQESDLGVDIIYYDDIEDGVEILSKYVEKDKTMGIDKTWPSKFLIRLQELGGGSKFVNGSPIIDYIRMVKDEKEQDLMRKSSKINDIAMDKIIPWVVKGLTEKELNAKMREIYKELGCEDVSFDPITAYGHGAADPHHVTDDSKGKRGDCVILDIGGFKDNYASDMTRTVFLGNVSEEQKKVYNIVKTANERAIAAVKPGVRFCDVDAAARDYITEQGYGPYFVHRTGHNIGQEVHEAGDVSSANTDILKPGMTFSIEPGIYLTGNFGVRVEDLVLVTEDGCKVLNHFTKDLIVVPEK